MKTDHLHVRFPQNMIFPSSFCIKICSNHPLHQEKMILPKLRLGCFFIAEFCVSLPSTLEVSKRQPWAFSWFSYIASLIVVRSLVSFHLKKMIQNCMAVLSPKKLTKRRPFMPVSTPHIGVPWCSLLSGSATLQRKGVGPQLASSKAKNTGNYTASEGNVVWKPVATKKPTQK